MATHYLKYFPILYALHVVNFYTVNSTQQPLITEIEDPLEYKLTKFLDVHIGKDSVSPNSCLRNTVRSEVLKVLEGLRNELIDAKQNVRPDTLEAGKDNRFQQLLEALKELHSEVSGMKKNIPSYQDDIKNFIYKSPVGVSYNNQILPYFWTSSLYSKNLWKNSSHMPKNCKEVQLQGSNISGIYKIQPVKTEKPFISLCDMETRGGGWTHIQKRYDGSQDFFLNWREYKFGFGDLEREFWLGLENIYSLTNSGKSELLVEIVDRENNKAYFHYKEFKIGSESTGYPLQVLSGFSGDAGDSLGPHVGSKFSTKDFDQDNDTRNCAETFSGAWWYTKCHFSNLNGKYRNSELSNLYQYEGMHWKDFRGHEYSHSKSRMLVRPSE